MNLLGIDLSVVKGDNLSVCHCVVVVILVTKVQRGRKQLPAELRPKQISQRVVLEDDSFTADSLISRGIRTTEGMAQSASMSNSCPLVRQGASRASTFGPVSTPCHRGLRVGASPRGGARSGQSPAKADEDVAAYLVGRQTGVLHMTLDSVDCRYRQFCATHGGCHAYN